MSWSRSYKGTPDEVRSKLHGARRDVIDTGDKSLSKEAQDAHALQVSLAVKGALEYVNLTPAGLLPVVSISGHANADGGGSYSVNCGFVKPEVVIPEA